MTIQQLTEEFVRHYDNLNDNLKLRANNPDGLRSALDEHPGLGASLSRLGKIFVRINHYRRFSENRYIALAHPRFGEALRNFEEQWRDAYNECRDRIYTQVLNRIAQEFLCSFHLVVERTGDAPMALEQLEKTDTELMDACHELWEIQRALDSRPEFGRFIDRGPDEFRVALADWNERWKGIILALKLAKPEL